MIASGNGWELRLGDWREALADVECDAIVCDPPYGERVHAVNLDCNDTGITSGLTPGYESWTAEHVMEFVRAWSTRCRGWMVALTSHDLVPAWEEAYADVGRYCFAPIPCVMRGMSVRMLGDGPSSWSVQAVVARPKTVEFSRWGALGGAYTGPRGDESGGGRGKPDWLISALVRDYSKDGDLVCDPFAGWGSTLARAVALGRKSIGSERDVVAFDEAVSRLSRPMQAEMWTSTTSPEFDQSKESNVGLSIYTRAERAALAPKIAPDPGPNLQVHPAAEHFPLMSEERFQDLLLSIQRDGLIDPIVLYEGQVIDGRHRLKACAMLGVEPHFKEIQSDANPFAFVESTNMERRDLDPFQRETIRLLIRLDSAEWEQKSRERSAGKKKSDAALRRAGRDSNGLESTCTSRDVQVEAKSKNRNLDSATVQRAKALVSADIELAKKVAAGSIRGMAALRQIKRAKLSERVAALPVGKHRVIYADPPWKYGDERAGLVKSETAAAAQYPTMSTSDICALDVKSIAADDSVLFMWATFPLLEDAIAVIKAWGFKYKTAIVWDKQRSNLGNYHDARAELLMIATRGSCPIEIDTRPKQVQSIARGRHSAKPEEFRALIDEMYPTGPRIELFRRGAPPTGWSVWGNESEGAA